MKRAHAAPSVTSLPQSPQDEATHRVRRYAVTMGIRTVCFLLMALVQPVGWWTWVFGAAAVFLPYIAVVYANAGEDSTPSGVESPVQQIEATAGAAPSRTDDDSAVFTIVEHDAGDDPIAEYPAHEHPMHEDPKDDAR